MSEKGKKYLELTVCFAGILMFVIVIATVLRGISVNNDINVEISETEPSHEGSSKVDSVSDNDSEKTVVFVTDEKSAYSNKLNMYDSFLSSLFTNSPYTISVSESILTSLNSQVSGVSSLVPYISRQVEISHSGLSYEDDKIDYLAICNVYCLDENSEIISFTSVVNFLFDSNDTLIDASIKAYR